MQPSRRHSLLHSLASASQPRGSSRPNALPSLPSAPRCNTKEDQKRPQFLLSGHHPIHPSYSFIHASTNSVWRPAFSSIRYETSGTAEVASETFNYQAEVSRLLDLIVHSLYSHKEVFLREIVSNASDALDKLRYLSVTDTTLLDGNFDLEVRVKADPEIGSLTIIDTGIGMTKDELIENLGTIAQSGTANFFKALKENKDNPDGSIGLIGQFGVGFYSAFLVAQRIVVSSKHAKSNKQYVWEGEADSSSFTIREETDPEKLLPRGTSITLFLKKDAKHKYSDPNHILNLVKNYSQFVTFPIYVWLAKTREVTSADDSDKVNSEAGDNIEYKDNKGFVTKNSWELVNEMKPIWIRSPKDVSKAEYEDFYKKTFKEFLEPLAYSHFSTEGEIEFKSILYIPGLPPFSSEEMINPKVKNIRLYVKRVFISDQFDNQLFPRYLSFIKGVVDSSDLPLNVSREILQESRLMRVMKKRLMRKTFDMINDIAKKDDKEDYNTFWINFGKYMKLGCVEDTDNHKHLAPLLRFYSSKHANEMIGLKDYVQDMKNDQKCLYYLAADSLKSAQAAPFLEELTSRDLEVLFLIEPIDEVAIGNLKSFQGKPFVDITKEEFDLGKDETKEELKKELQPLCDWMEKKLTGKIGNVQVSNRTMSAPCVIVSGKSGFSANMERILKAQALLADMGDMMDTMRETRTLEINTNHPVIKYLNLLYKDGPSSSYANDMVQLLYEATALSTGFALEEPASFGRNIFKLMARNLTKQREQEPTVQPQPVVSS